jgi:hypothetical protein
MRTPAPRRATEPVPSLKFRYWGFYTDAEGTPVELDATMRAHAHVKQHIGRLKDSGLGRLPFTSFEANASWMMAVAITADLVRWFSMASGSIPDFS